VGGVGGDDEDALADLGQLYILGRKDGGGAGGGGE